MRNICAPQPQQIFFVFKPYGASRLFTEPALVLNEWQEGITQGKPPVCFLSVGEAAANQLRRTSNPANTIDAFSVVSVTLDEFPSGLKPLSPVENGLGKIRPYALSAEVVEYLRHVLLTPGYVGLQMRLLTDEKAREIGKHGVILSM